MKHLTLIRVAILPAILGCLFFSTTLLAQSTAKDDTGDLEKEIKMIVDNQLKWVADSLGDVLKEIDIQKMMDGLNISMLMDSVLKDISKDIKVELKLELDDVEEELEKLKELTNDFQFDIDLDLDELDDVEEELEKLKGLTNGFQFDIDPDLDELDDLKELKNQMIQIRKNDDGSMDTIIFIGDFDEPDMEFDFSDLEEAMEDLEEIKGEKIIKKFEWKGKDDATEVHTKIVIIQIYDEDLSKADKEIIKSINRNKNLKTKKELDIDQLKFYPNPGNGQLNLQFELPDDGTTTIAVYSMDGKEVYLETIADFTGRYNGTIDLTDKDKGVYLLQIVQGKKALNRKIVLQ